MEQKNELLDKITEKKEFSRLKKIDVEMAFNQFARRQVSDYEKIRLTRDLLRKIFSAFTSQKILSPKNKNAEWILRKHLSTRERLQYYEEVYGRIFKGENYLTIIDLGAGINGFSYEFIRKFSSAKYVAVEAVGQLVDLMNDFFQKEYLNAEAHHLSLFELSELKNLVGKTRKPRIAFLFKTLDSLEMMQRDFSKEILSELSKLSDRIVVSFATRSMIKRTKFRVQRNWIVNFIEENFKIVDDFEIGNERYIIFEN